MHFIIPTPLTYTKSRRPVAPASADSLSSASTVYLSPSAPSFVPAPTILQDTPSPQDNSERSSRSLRASSDGTLPSNSSPLSASPPPAPPTIKKQLPVPVSVSSGTSSAVSPPLPPPKPSTVQPPPLSTTSQAELLPLPKVPKQLPSLPRSTSEMITPSHNKATSSFLLQTSTQLNRQQTEVFSAPKACGNEEEPSAMKSYPNLESSYYEISLSVSNIVDSNKFLVCTLCNSEYSLKIGL